MASDGPAKLEYRVMGDYSISKSYKGILRIAHIMETVGTEKDYFLNPTYYGAPTSLMDISGNGEESKVYGFPNASVGFEGKVKRYISDKEYKNMKLPMTDSMGNYLNWNIGIEDTTIGSDEQNNGYSIFRDRVLQDDYNEEIIQPKVFPILESKELVIGLEPKLKGEEKTYLTNAGKLFLMKDDKSPALVISNLYDNSPSNKTKVSGISDGYTFKKDTKLKHRTVYKSTKDAIEEYDAYVYSQENYNSQNFFCNNEENLIISDKDIDYNKTFENIEKDTNVDAEVDIYNLKDYVKEIISKYMKSNTVEVPTGTVIWQYISPQKWYGTGDSGSGNGEYTTLTKDCNVGHRPNMGQRSTTEGNTIWNDSLIQGASQKTNKLSVRNNRYKEKTEDDSAFDSARLKEIIPLYKRDYVLCDGSTYYITLMENNSANIAYKKKYDSYERFIDLFYNIGYNYSVSKNSGSLFSDIKQRYYSTIVKDDNGVYRFKFKNLCANYETPPPKIYIDEKNYMEYAKDEGKPWVAPWGSSTSNLKDSDTLYSIDMATMLAYKLLLKEDMKDINSAFIVDGRYNRNKAEEWLKKQPIPSEYVFNSFVGDVPGTTYTTIEGNTQEIDVISFPYIMTNGDSRNVMIGREVSSFDSYIKYFVPGDEKSGYKGGKYYICKVWQIAEIQYILDVLISGSGERNSILPSKFEFRFKVPNLTESVRPKFIGSGGFIWRDQRNNDMEVSGSWSSSYTIGTIPHRHAIFKGSLSGFGDNNNIVKLKAETLNNANSIPTSSAHLHTLSEMPEGGKNGAAGGEVTDGTGSYIWNEMGEVEGVYFESDKSQFGIKVIQRKDFVNGDSYPDFFKNSTNGGDTTGFEKGANVTGPYGTMFQKTGPNRVKRINVVHDEYYTDYPSDSTSDYQKYLEWYLGKSNNGGEHRKWYSFQHDEDPRFSNFEPNRCPTSPPKDFNGNKYVIYTKNDINENETPDGTSFYFAPEHVKATPLIKL